MTSRVDPLAELSAAGGCVWLDDLSRMPLAAGTLRRLVRDQHVPRVPTNPTIFANAITHVDTYDARIQDLSRRGVGIDEALRMMTTFDVRWPCDALQPVYDATGVDGRVSIDVAPAVSPRGRPDGRRGPAAVVAGRSPQHVHQDSPTPAGLPANAACLAEGISVNVTLIFSLQRYSAVMDAFIDGMERAAAAGGDLGGLASVASFFASRVHSEIDRRLATIGSPEARALMGNAGVANARLADKHHEEVLHSGRARALMTTAARPQRHRGPPPA